MLLYLIYFLGRYLHLGFISSATPTAAAATTISAAAAAAAAATAAAAKALGSRHPLLFSLVVI